MCGETGATMETVATMEPHTWRTGDKCYHMHSWREGKVVECQEGDYMHIAFNQQQKKDCWCGWSGGHDGASETRRKHPYIYGESPLPNVYWSYILEKRHHVDDDMVKTHLMIARSQRQNDLAWQERQERASMLRASMLR